MLVEIYGEAGTGKTELARQLVCEWNTLGKEGCAVWVDLKGTFDATGVDLGDLVVLHPVAPDGWELLTSSKSKVGLLVIDGLVTVGTEAPEGQLLLVENLRHRGDLVVVTRQGGSVVPSDTLSEGATVRCVCHGSVVGEVNKHFVPSWTLTKGTWPIWGNRAWLNSGARERR
jgi:hypothetical protein